MSRELEFERPILELERQIEELRRIAAGRDRLANVVSTEDEGGYPQSELPDPKLDVQIQRLEDRARQLQKEIFSSLGRWQIVQLSRHPQRPYTLDYVAAATTDFVELHGDRAFADDPAVVGGLARLSGGPVVVIGQQKGRTTKENVLRNFGMARPEGYRKAARLMRLADRFGLPIVTFIDTPGAFPGLEAEERGQALAIAECLETMAGLSVPVVSVVIGEGGSGGALAIGVANVVLMLGYATYSVISPEACSSILFKDATHAEQAADALKLCAADLLALGIVDEVIEEPAGGAHRDPPETARRVRAAIERHLRALGGSSGDELRRQRYDRFRRLGRFRPAAAEKESPA